MKLFFPQIMYLLYDELMRLLGKIFMWLFFWPFLIFYYPIKYIFRAFIPKKESGSSFKESEISDKNQFVDKNSIEKEKTRIYKEKRELRQKIRRMEREMRNENINKQDIELLKERLTNLEPVKERLPNLQSKTSGKPVNLKKIQTYIDMALQDGDISDKEISVLKRKAKGLGIKEDELEMILESQIVNKRRTCPTCGATIKASSTECMYCGR